MIYLEIWKRVGLGPGFKEPVGLLGALDRAKSLLSIFQKMALEGSDAATEAGILKKFPSILDAVMTMDGWGS